MKLPKKRGLPIRHAFSIVEGAFSVLLVGGLLVAALNTVGGSVTAQRATADRGRGQLLAAALLAEVLQQEYSDPNQPAVLGRESTESAASRNDFDDVDDYNGWTELPPQAKDGTVIPNLTGWQRTVQVALVNAVNLQTSVADGGLKQITVVVAYNGRTVATLVALKGGTPGSLSIEDGDPYFEDPVLPW